MLPAIQNGFTFIAFLMFVAGGLLALEKYAKWKIFNYMPRSFGSICSTWCSARWACSIPTRSRRPTAV